MTDLLISHDPATTGGSNIGHWDELESSTLTPTVGTASRASDPFVMITYSNVLVDSSARRGPGLSTTLVTGGTLFDSALGLLAYLVAFVDTTPRHSSASPADTTVSELVERLRSDTGLSMAELADVLSVSRRSVYTWTSRGLSLGRTYVA